jgi:DNA-binding MarR family transcriptional regulator
MRLFKNQLALTVPEALLLMAISNEGKTEVIHSLHLSSPSDTLFD